MAQAISLAAEDRKVFGKKVKQLRSKGIIPANIFGQGVKSTAIQVVVKDFAKIYHEAGETGLVSIKVGEKEFPVLVHLIQRDPRSDQVLHIDFHQVNLKEKTTANVPVLLVGEAPIEKSKEGIVLHNLNEVEVEALPTDIPHNIEVSIDNLTEVGQTVLVKDLKIDRSKVEIKADPEAVVLSVQTAEVKEEEPVVETPTDVEVITEKAEEASEGATPEAAGESKPKE